MKHLWPLVGSAAVLLLFIAQQATLRVMAQERPSPSKAPNDEMTGIEVGQYAPDFQLEPVELHADFRRWLGDDAPKSFADTMRLSDFRDEAPVVLLFGSFT